MISQYSLRETGADLAQDAGPGSSALGVQLLLNYPGDYNLAVQQALRMFERDFPNVRVVDQVLAAGGFRFVVYGTGALAGLTGADAWVPEQSQILELFGPYQSTVQGQRPMDPNNYRVIQDTGDRWVLELTDGSLQTGETLRLRFTGQHRLTEAPNTVTDPAAAPTVALASPAAPGNVDDGLHSWKFVWVTAQGTTLPSPASAQVTVVDKTVNGQVAVTVPAAAADQGVTAARIYRRIAGDTGTWKLVGTLTATNGGGIFTDNVADASLGADAPSTSTAGGVNTVPESRTDAMAALVASQILELAAVKAVQNTGNTGLPNDVVDRRSQADQFSSRAKSFRNVYSTLVGIGGTHVNPASGFRDLDVESASGIGFIWHPTNRR